MFSRGNSQAHFSRTSAVSMPSNPLNPKHNLPPHQYSISKLSPHSHPCSNSPPPTPCKLPREATLSHFHLSHTPFPTSRVNRSENQGKNLVCLPVSCLSSTTHFPSFLLPSHRVTNSNTHKTTTSFLCPFLVSRAPPSQLFIFRQP